MRLKEEEGEGPMRSGWAGTSWITKTFVGQVEALGFKPEYGESHRRDFS